MKIRIILFGLLLLSANSHPRIKEKELIAKIYKHFFPRNDAHPYPGELYSIGKYRLHLFCTGIAKYGVPAVILESGVGNYSTDWIFVQSEISKYTQVCSYDRAGYGWSEEWGEQKNISDLHNVLPRTIDNNVTDLNLLLNKAGINNSIILVGQSYGALISLAFENKFPIKVGALVLIDPHDDGVFLPDDSYNNAISEWLREYKKRESAERKMEWNKNLEEMAQHILGNQNQALRTDLFNLINSLDYLKWSKAMFSEWRALHSDCTTIKNNPSKTLKQKPLTVISSDPFHKNSEGRIYLHKKITQLSNRGKLIVAMGAGHDIAADRPDIVIKEVIQRLEILNEKASPQMQEEQIYKAPLNQIFRFYVDWKVDKKDDLKKFCEELGLGFNAHAGFGFIDHRKKGSGGHFISCIYTK